MLRTLLWWVALASILAPAGAQAEPVDLANATPRWVWVRFEISPPELPGQTDAQYTSPQAAWFEPSDDGAEVRMTVSGSTVESDLLAHQDPVAGSFSDFRWSIDPRTGHVLSATLEGEVVRHLDFGVAKAKVPAKVRFEMSTLRAAGFRSTRRILGETVNRYCTPPGARSCTAVEPRQYDPETGYVNAVGSVQVDSRIMRLKTFSTLGEARLSEMDPSEAGPTLAAAP